MKIKTEYLLGGAAVLAVGYWLWARNQKAATLTAAQISRQPVGPHAGQVVTYSAPFHSSSEEREMERGSAFVKQILVGKRGKTTRDEGAPTADPVTFGQRQGQPSTSRVAAQPGHPQDPRGRMSAPFQSFRPQSGSGTRRVPS